MGIKIFRREHQIYCVYFMSEDISKIQHQLGLRYLKNKQFKYFSSLLNCTN